MKTNKFFNEWIATNFKGLSAKTLKQFILKEYALPVDYVDNMIYVDLFGYFARVRNDHNTDVFLFCKDVVTNCIWL